MKGFIKIPLLIDIGLNYITIINCGKPWQFKMHLIFLFSTVLGKVNAFENNNMTLPKFSFLHLIGTAPTVTHNKKSNKNNYCSGQPKPMIAFHIIDGKYSAIKKN
jgi:hypothetical protein